MKGLIHDLSACTRFNQVTDAGGDTVRREYPLPGGAKMVLTKQRDAQGYPSGIEAKIGDLLLGRAEILHQDFEGKEVEEIHFSSDGSGRIIYRARSRFGGFKRKTEETRLEGNKMYELFPEWF